jgi:hypothetical protein
MRQMFCSTQAAFLSSFSFAFFSKIHTQGENNKVNTSSVTGELSCFFKIIFHFLFLFHFVFLDLQPNLSIFMLHPLFCVLYLVLCYVKLCSPRVTLPCAGEKDDKT